jgi:hypothetical protein
MDSGKGAKVGAGGSVHAKLFTAHSRNAHDSYRLMVEKILKHVYDADRSCLIYVFVHLNL